MRSLVAVSICVVTFGLTVGVVACGGSNEQAGGANSANSAGGGAAGGGSGGGAGAGDTAGSGGTGAGTSAGGGAGMDDAGPTTTTTTTLGNNGDLQGAKLTQSSSSSYQVTADGGPKPDAHGSEPGRRREDIQAVIVSRRDEFRKCYDDVVNNRSAGEGDLDVKWTIDPKGNVTDIGVDDAKSQIHDPSVSSCIVTIIKKIHFAESPKGFETRTHYPFNFHPKGTQKH